MDTASEITVAKLRSALGTPAAPLILDVRRRAAFDADPYMLPGAIRCDPDDLEALAPTIAEAAAERPVAVYCVRGHEVSKDAAASLRRLGMRASHLGGGIEAWIHAAAPTMRKRADLGIPSAGGSKWVTRARPKIDRIACPWLIRRFVDPHAQFLYVPADKVIAAAADLGATPYDVPDVEFSHSGEMCTFDAVLSRFGLADPCLDALAVIVRGADTGKPELTPQSPGLLAISLGLSVNFTNDLEMLKHGLVMYDALYSWLRAARGEIHNADLFRNARA